MRPFHFDPGITLLPFGAPQAFTGLLQGTDLMKYRQLVGRRVLDADGTRVGRVYDLIAERRGDDLSVKCLVIGPSGLLRRIGLNAWEPRRIAWTQVSEINSCIRLRAESDEMDLPEEE